MFFPGKYRTIVVEPVEGPIRKKTEPSRPAREPSRKRRTQPKRKPAKVSGRMGVAR